MKKRRLSRPSLKVTQHVDEAGVSSFIFEVWSPFTWSYQRVGAMEDGLRRAAKLADLICQMWLQGHPQRNALADVPDLDVTDDSLWAEFRINATTYRSYDTRWYDRPGWTRAAGMIPAVESTCARVGCTMPKFSKSRSASGSTVGTQDISA